MERLRSGRRSEDGPVPALSVSGEEQLVFVLSIGVGTRLYLWRPPDTGLAPGLVGGLVPWRSPEIRVKTHVIEFQSTERMSLPKR